MSDLRFDIAAAFAVEAPPLSLLAQEKLNVDDPLDNVRELERRLNVLEDALQLAPLPAGPPDESYDRALGLRTRAIRGRLFRLGYLREDSGSEELDRDLEMAIAHFQLEARPLVVDGWVGSHSWDALQELVAFESDFKLEKWLDADGNPCPALVRAAMLRLRVFGLTNAEVSGDLQAAIGPLVEFGKVSKRLGLMPAEATPSSLEPMRLLLSHETLFEGLTRPGSTARGLLPFKTEGHLSEIEPRERRFLAHWVHIELWLRGYDVGDVYEDVTLKSLRPALQAVWRSAVPELPEDQIERRTLYIQEPLLDELRRTAGEARLPMEQLQDFVERNRDELQKGWLAAIKDRAFFLWDGIKRAARWIADRVADLGATIADLWRKGRDYVYAFVSNVVKALFRGASKVLTAVRKGVSAFVAGTRAYLGGGVKAEKAPLQAACRLFADCDTVLWVGSQGRGSASGEVLARLELMADSLAFSAYVVPLVAALIAQAFGGLLAWPLLLLQLLRSREEISARYEALIAGEERLAEFVGEP